MKKLLKLIVVLVILALIGLLVFGMMIDSIVKTGIEEVGTSATGVTTTVENVSISILGGTMLLEGLQLANPEGYETPHMMKSGKLDVGIDTGSIFADTVRLTKFELDGLDLNIESKGIGKTNVGEIMDHLNKLVGDKERDTGSKNIVIDTIIIKNVTVNIKVPLKDDPITVKVPELKLENVSPDSSKGLIAEEIVGKLLAKILASVLEEGGDLIPGDLKNTLTKDLGKLTETLTKDLEDKLKDGPGKVLEGMKDIKLPGIFDKK